MNVEAAATLNMAPPSRQAAAPWRSLLQIFFTALCGAASELCLKVGAMQTRGMGDMPAWLGISGLLSKWVWFGIFFTVLSFIVYLNAVRFVPLGVAFTLASVVHVLIPLGAWLLLGEVIGPRRWVGIGLVLIGLFVIAKPFASVEQRL